jgi:hypothetical protein
MSWLLSGAALVLALAAVVRSSRLSRRFQRLSQAHWELRYEHDQLRARLDAASGSGRTGDDPGPPSPRQAFVPLSSLRQ